jgi:hypothetical protein
MVGANSRGGDRGNAGAGVGDGGGEGASLRSMSRCGGRSMAGRGSRSRSSSG